MTIHGAEQNPSHCISIDVKGVAFQKKVGIPLAGGGQLVWRGQDQGMSTTERTKPVLCPSETVSPVSKVGLKRTISLYFKLKLGLCRILG